MIFRLTIRARLIILSGALLCMLVATNLYLTSKLANNSAAVAKETELSGIIDSANNARIAFGEMRYWLTDLYVWIETLRVEGGVLDGFDQKFDPKLNVLIGGRGTGKSSVIELIRFGLGTNSYTESGQQEAMEHALGVLGDGRVTLILSNGRERIEVMRTAQDPEPELTDSFISPFVFSQSEIEMVGLQAQSRLRLIDGFLSVEQKQASRDRALETLSTDHFDLVILDRKIPTQDGFLDDHQDHGWLVFQHVRERLLGTPVWFLTGTEDNDFATEMNNDFGRAGDLHGREQPEPLYLVFWKRKIADCVRRIRDFADKRAELNRIPVRLDAGGAELRPEELNVLRLFGRRYNGSTIDLTSLNGGFSRSRVLKVVVRDANGGALISAAAKVSPLTDIRDEAQRYRTDIARLTPGGFPQLSVTIDVGAGNYGGLFYGMVGDTVESLFSRIANGHAQLPTVPQDIRAIEDPWYQTKRVESVQVGQIRRKLIGDAALQVVRGKLDGIDIGPIEACVVRAGICCQHGDLHCANVVFAERGQAMLIDFGDAGTSFSALDPITLELSTIFHSQHVELPPDWPNEQNIASWISPERFVEGCTFGPFIGACRQWALSDGGSPEEVTAVAYAYAIRQLKYADTDKTKARALIRACIAHLVK